VKRVGPTVRPRSGESVAATSSSDGIILPGLTAVKVDLGLQNWNKWHYARSRRGLRPEVQLPTTARRATWSEHSADRRPRFAFLRWL